MGDNEGFFMGGRTFMALLIAGLIIMTNLSTEQFGDQIGRSYVAQMEVTSTIVIVWLATIFLPKYLKIWD